MKKVTLALAIISIFAVVGSVQAEDVTTKTLATWSATAVKDTTSKLVVTPVSSLYFQYAEGIKGFSSQKGQFNVTIEGGEIPTDFKLTSKLVSNTLTQQDPAGSTLEVGVNYRGATVEKNAGTVMVDTSANIMGAGLQSLTNADKSSDRTSAQDQFDFSIVRATADGTHAVTDFSTLPEGVWTGDVSVEFEVFWTL
ncbi:fimbrillin MatB-like protein [Serratia fonticola]|jgi:hypothetical protein|uniref:Common pilus major fimbrillin subunit EcpA n=1 Tax=Serratia fonticola TaxID=47917 RepID=A0A559T8T8_SERFO|nr:common pilus major fimbrillin subunit EcpA [Serratia fonticola]TQI81448.1 fimbrillin MatB-like protein [Serratia fonticola]TQI96528.1 fimbrillin MatB-like protein [Serratia fonticola]TVZ71025.1 fimbrillin MatB-like protein [Serratia fonticola]